MNDPALAVACAGGGLAACILAAVAASSLKEAGGAAALLARLRRYHARLAASLFDGPLGRVPGRGLADPSAALLSGAVASASLLLACLSVLGVRSLLLTVPLLPFSSCLLGRASLASAGRRALAGIRRDLPGCSLLLSLLLDAGLSIPAAIPEALAAMEGRPLWAELSRLQAARSVGEEPEEAYRRAMERTRDEDLHAFLSILRQGERSGTGVARSLSELSSRMLEAEVHQAEAQAQKAPVRLLAPLVLFFLPSVALLVLSPVILSLGSGELFP